MVGKHRIELLAIISKVEQLIVDADASKSEGEALDDQAMNDATRKLGKLRRVARGHERKFSDAHQ
jgi:hypothetical protein